ncbi:hypothetical protein GCM10007304_38150 [Rhodococcoides trifolii]|uniref:DUF6779 domain-containing protein n=1 Tax=Rhodococcoides trifolii TaxID=908250 RepID=A0A917G3G2_9NOCA|nr:DUF6779 domain-containing protein [Rhodococcus trifolii]GGG20608.1 hypothetical protein GCM10007304_38150 [Rhodococcus trifolii]
MTDTGRTKATRRTRRGGSQAIIAALIFLGVVASVILLLTDSVQWLRLGIVIALWAAIVGAFAMTKYRRDSTADQVKARDLQTVYELQLEREIAARREYELGVEARVRGEVGGDSSELRALRNELASLRRSLEMLFDGALPEDRAAIAGEAMRMRELADRSYSGYQPAPSGLYVRAPYATPADEPVTAETSVIHGEFDSSGSFRPAPEWMTDESAEAESGSAADEDGIPEFDMPYREPAPYEATPYRSDAEEPETFEPVSFDDDRFDETEPPVEEPVAVAAEPVVAEPVAVAPAAATPSSSTLSTPDYSTPEFSMPGVTTPEVVAADQATPSAPSTDTDAPESGRRSRRRAAESESADANGGAHSSGRSVADILAGIGGSTDSGTAEVGRRRRRAD